MIYIYLEELIQLTSKNASTLTMKMLSSAIEHDRISTTVNHYERNHPHNYRFSTDLFKEEHLVNLGMQRDDVSPFVVISLPTMSNVTMKSRIYRPVAEYDPREA